MNATVFFKLKPSIALASLCLAAASPLTAQAFSAGDLVLSVYGNGAGTGVVADNQASPITLMDVTTSGTFVSNLVLPQSSFTDASGVLNSVISGEYGSSSEGSLQLSADGQSLVIAGYGINANTFNSATGNTSNAYGTQALAQTTSVLGGTYTPVSRVIADISADGTVNTSTALFGVYNTNNPRSVTTVNGSSFYLGGQGVKGDSTQGVFLAQSGASTATAINNSTDVRTVSIFNGQLYVSTDSKQAGATGTSKGSANIAVYGSTLPTGATSPSVLAGISNSTTIAGNGNGLASGKVNLSPENFFFANATTLYVADGGIPKQTGLGDGGLQKWTLINGNWNLAYTISAGLGLVANTATAGTTGLIGLTGKVVGDQVQLFATNATINDLDQTALYGVSDSLSATRLASGEGFTTLVTAAPNTVIRGVAFAPTVSPVPEAGGFAMALFGMAGLAAGLRRRAGARASK